MKKTLTLKNPIEIDGKKVETLSYDTNEITVDQFSEACARSAAIEKNKSITFKMKENDYALHLYLGFMAVIALNPEIDVKDLERIKGFDTLALADVGMLFIYRSPGAASPESKSEERFENTAELTIQASQI